MYTKDLMKKDWASMARNMEIIGRFCNGESINNISKEINVPKEVVSDICTAYDIQNVVEQARGVVDYKHTLVNLYGIDNTIKKTLIVGPPIAYDSGLTSVDNRKVVPINHFYEVLFSDDVKYAKCLNKKSSCSAEIGFAYESWVFDCAEFEKMDCWGSNNCDSCVHYSKCLSDRIVFLSKEIPNLENDPFRMKRHIWKNEIYLDIVSRIRKQQKMGGIGKISQEAQTSFFSTAGLQAEDEFFEYCLSTLLSNLQAILRYIGHDDYNYNPLRDVERLNEGDFGDCLRNLRLLLSDKRLLIEIDEEKTSKFHQEPCIISQLQATSKNDKEDYKEKKKYRNNRIIAVFDCFLDHCLQIMHQSCVSDAKRHGVWKTARFIANKLKDFDVILGDDIWQKIDKISINGSSYEKTVASWLAMHNLDFVREKTFNDLKDKNSLRFDFFIESMNTIVEVDGEQHEIAVKYKAVSDKINVLKDKGNKKTKEEKKEYKSLWEQMYKYQESRFSYDVVYNHDQMKNKYCADNNIHLIRVNYDEIENLDEKLSSLLLKK